MIHGSFVGTHVHAHPHVHTHTLHCTVAQKCTPLSTHSLIMLDGFHLWHFMSNKNPLHCLNVNKKGGREHSTHRPQSVTAGGRRFKEVCLYPATRTHTPRYRCLMPLIVLALFTHAVTHTSSEVTRQLFVDECSVFVSQTSIRQSSQSQNRVGGKPRERQAGRRREAGRSGKWG